MKTVAKITEVKTFIMRGVERNWLFVKIETDAGIHGWGEASLELKEKVVEAAIHQMSGYIMGQDATRIEHLWQILFRHGFWRGGVVLNSAISGLDQALWDIAGKLYKVPVYKLLGGECRDRVRVYAHGGPNVAKEILNEGYTGIKMGSGPTQRRPDQFVVEKFVEQVAAMREIVGPSIDIMVDNHGRSTPQQAIKMIRAVENYHLLFFEEPTPPDNPDSLQRIADCNFDTDIATGERLYTRWGFKTIIEKQLVAVIQPDLCHAGGISEVRRIAAMAETYYIKVAPHNPYGPVSTAACVHLCAATPNFLILEYVRTNEPWRSKVQVGEPMRAQNGYIELPTAPGLGIDLDEEVLKSRPYEDAGRGMYGNFHDDGSVADV